MKSLLAAVTGEIVVLHQEDGREPTISYVEALLNIKCIVECRILVELHCGHIVGTLYRYNPYPRHRLQTTYKTHRRESERTVFTSPATTSM